MNTAWKPTPSYIFKLSGNTTLSVKAEDITKIVSSPSVLLVPFLLIFLQFPLKCWPHPGVLVSSGCYHKVLWTLYNSYSINSRNVFPTALELQVKQSRVPTWSDSSEDPLLVADCPLLIASSDSRKRMRWCSSLKRH